MDGIADYVFIRLLGEGNHGRCWLAHHGGRLDRAADQVVVKTLPRRADVDSDHRVTDTLRGYVAASSPALVPLHDAGHQEEHLFTVWEYQRAGSLQQTADDLVPRQILDVIACAARGAHALHEAGVAHGNIKPPNVFLRHDGRGALGDIGLTQSLRRGQTITGIGPVDALEYLAPEAIRTADRTRASDVWALGATAHAALTGGPLYPGILADDLLASLRHVISTRPAVDPALPGPVRQVIEWCLAPDPGDRPLTAEHLALQLEALVTLDAPA